VLDGIYYVHYANVTDWLLYITEALPYVCAVTIL
jgi:hypothetical protein